MVPDRATPMREKAGVAEGPAAGLYELVDASPQRSLAVIGLVKNAGKTTVVNSLMANCGRRFGLTSLGLDGERTDHLTGLAKPSIAPPAGTLVATTRGSLDRSRYDMHVLEELPFHTPLGRVLIGRAGGEGKVEVSGPTTLAELRYTIERLQAHGAAQVLVDGAINRLGSASPRVSEGVVMATGGMVGDSLDDVLATTVATLDMLLLPATDAAIGRLVEAAGLESARAVSVDDRGDVEALDLRTVVGEGVSVAREVERRRTRTLFIGGALTQEFVDDFTRVLPPRRELRVVVRDADRAGPAGDDREPLPAARHRSRGARRRCGARRHGQPVPRAPAVPAQTLLQRGRRRGRRPRPRLRRRQRARRAGRRGEPARLGLSLTKEGGVRVNNALQLDAGLVERARAAADAIADDIQQHIEEHTTDTTERATLRLLGIIGVNEIDVPLVNVVVEHARGLLSGGIMRPFVDLMLRTGRTAQQVAEGVSSRRAGARAGAGRTVRRRRGARR